MRKMGSALVLALLASFGSMAWAAEATIKLGVIAELTGDMPAVGASCKNAAEMAVKEINTAGGLLVGKQKMKVELVVEDNAGKADQAAATAQKLITQDEVWLSSDPTPVATPSRPLRLLKAPRPC